MKKSPSFLPNIQSGLYLFVFFFFSVAPAALFAQCSNWSISAQLVTTSVCAGSGSFVVTASGPDVANLTNLQYGILTSANGFSVPLNNSSTFNNIPGGTYQVSAVAGCGGSIVGKNTNITVPGSYVPPTMVASLIRGSISCGAFGQIGLAISNGVAPYTINITGAPSSYSGPVSFSSGINYYDIDNLPPGNYSIQAVDACGSGTIASNVMVTSLDISTLQLTESTPTNTDCNTLVVPKPFIYSSGEWTAYVGDPLFTVSVQISGNISAATPYQTMDYNSFTISLPAGITIKDCYGQTITYTVKTPCGSTVQTTQQIQPPYISNQITQNCNANFTNNFNFIGPVCYPITYSLQNTTTGNNYGPYTISGSVPISTPSLPLGSYTMNYTTGDGYLGTNAFSASIIVGNPYAVSIANGIVGLDNYVQGFNFYTGYALSYPITVELFSSPAGYSFLGTWYPGTGAFPVYQNQTPGPGTLEFAPGNYVWKITDSCGTYLLPITVGGPDLYQYTVGIGNQRQTCEGLWVTPSGTATNNGTAVPFYFQILKNDFPMFSTNTYNWPQYALGDSFLVNSPGTYTIVPSSSYNYGGYNPTIFVDDGYLGYPNVYTNTYTFTYSVSPIEVDLNNSQGFLCKGGGPGDGIIYALGANGMPFTNPTTHYAYSLAAQGHGASGPYIATNTTGVFTNFGGNANAFYDVKVTDSCGAFAVQTLKILDLETAQLISSSGYAACATSTVQLSAIYLPNATYSWTGPDGFTSTLRTPTINNIGTQNIGVYYVTITSPACSQTLTDSTFITVNPIPAKPVLSISCTPIPVSLTVTDPVPGINYEWIQVYQPGYMDTMPPTSNNILTLFTGGTYKALAVDPSTGCFAYSDSVQFSDDPDQQLQATIYAPHLQLCTNDTTILVAQGVTNALGYQWYKNDVPITNATTFTYVTGVPGNYKVSILTGPCGSDTSASVAVTVVQPPVATISASTLSLCAGDNALIQANTGPNYTYTWYLNDSTISGVTSSTLIAAQAGSYYVVVSNGACIATSDSVDITVFPAFTFSLPADTVICNPANTAVFTTPATLQSVLWSTGDTVSSIIISQPGVYWVQGQSPCGAFSDTMNVVFCAPVISNFMPVNDTICEGDCIHPTATVTNYPLQYSWSFTGGSPDTSIAAIPGTICYSDTGTYNIKLVVSSAGGKDSAATQIVVASKPVPRFTDTSVTVTYKSDVTLPACADAQTIDWYQGDSLICTNCASINIDAKYYSTVYHCVVSNGNCSDSCIYKLQVIDIPHDLWLPDAFTPNGDGHNDFFHVITDNPNISVVNLEVYNRWGQLVFKSNLNNSGWDGTINGTPADVDTYFWLLRYKVLGADELYFKKGDVTLVR